MSQKFLKLWILVFSCLPVWKVCFAQEASEVRETYVAENQAWLKVEIGIIGAASSDILEHAMLEVESNGYYGLLIALDTPGGALEATRTMVKRILTASFPVVVWVGPAGARAGSAGAFITLAGHVASMAAGTNIGAAHPVQAGGQDIEESDIKTKIENDTVAFIESIAKLRGRNVEMSRSFVLNSLSVTAEEALENNVIDLIASSPTELIGELNAREVLINDEVFVLDTSGAQIFTYEKSVREKFLEILSNPNLFYLLFVAGIIGIGIELTNPGATIPGVLGGISLIVALIATSVLPVNFGAMLLILVAVAFMVAEVFIPSFGILGIGGLASFVLGSMLLIDDSSELGMAISWFTIAPAAIGIIGFGLLVSYLVVRVEKSKVTSGVESMLGQKAKAYQDFIDGLGQVVLSGEFWRATTIEGSVEEISKGDLVEVVGVEGLTLRVSKIQSKREE